MLVLYSAFLYLPGGNPAAGLPASIWPTGSNQLALIFTDSAGLVPAANPITTDASGFLSFYAAPGLYSAMLAGEVFPIPLDASVVTPVWPDLWVHNQVVASATWTVAHYFGVVPTVDLVLSGTHAEAHVAHPDTSNTILTFSSPQSGTAYLRR